MAISSSTILEMARGKFLVRYHQYKKDSCISFTNGNLTKRDTIVRLHSSCLFSETFHTKNCDCALQLDSAFKLIAKKNGVLIYLFQEGRGVGLANKIKAMEVERMEDIDTVEAFKKLHFPLDARDYSFAIHVLKELDVSKTIKLITNNPRKWKQLEKAGFTVSKRIKLSYLKSKQVKSYLQVKKEKLGHDI